MGEIAAKYGPKGLQVIRCVSGENELTALEFQKHYRLPVVHLLDVNRAVERQYNQRGWTFLMLVDEEGKVVHTAHGALAEQEERLARLMEGVLDEGGETTTIMRDGVPYAPATLARSGETESDNRRDRFPSVACGSDGRVYVVFTGNRNGNSDVFMRTFDGNDWSADRAIAGTEADEYDGAVLVDHEDRVWVSWTSNADGKNYNLFATSFTDPSKPLEPVQLTHAEDDAMHGRMACDRSGRVWLTYYKWHKMSGYSRDKEVYVRRSDGSGWSAEIHVSPDNVPRYEDHTDPAIAPYDDGVAVSWSWDFHRPVGYTGNAREPTIFLRTIDEDFRLGRLTTVSSGNIDTTPAMTVDRDRRIWCAWDSLVRDRPSDSFSKGLYFRKVDLAGKDQGETGESLSGLLKNVCTPSFAGTPTGALTLVWSESDSPGEWDLRSTSFDGNTGRRWTKPRTIISEGNPRFPAAAFDADGQLWIAYSAKTGDGLGIQVVKQDVSVNSDSQSQVRETPPGKDENTRIAPDLAMAEKLYRDVGQRMRGGDPAAAAAKFAELEKAYPQHNRTGCAALYVAQTYLRAGNHEKAEELLRRAIEKYPQSRYGNRVEVGAYATYLLAELVLQKGREQEAKTLFKRLIDRYPKAVDHRGQLLSDRARFSGASIPPISATDVGPPQLELPLGAA